MPDAVIHPTPQELAAFGLGKLSERTAAAIVAHLESCPACRQAVAGVSADSFVGKVRAAGPAGSSFPPGLTSPGNAPRSADQRAMATPYCPNLPPELAQHPKYRILRELGRGGMGVVYQARHKEMERDVVIKVINRSLLERPDSLERFRREIRAAAQLSHQNIVTAYDAERAGDAHMLVMEFVPGQSLAEVLKKKGPFPVSVACHFARQVALGLQHAYERGMVHRDIKPQNLMLTPKGQVKILDFGLAKVFREANTNTGLTSDNAYLGTPDYCAPEQATDARTADIRADLYSLGCTLYNLLAGRPPFREDTIVKTILAHQQKQPQPLPELRPEVPAELWQVVARLLAKEPAQRYEKPIEVGQVLVPFIKSGSKQEAKGGSALPQSTGAPGKGTVFELETSEAKKAQRAVPAKAPPTKVPAKNAASPLADLSEAGASPKETGQASESAKPPLPAGRKRPRAQSTSVSASCSRAWAPKLFGRKGCVLTAAASVSLALMLILTASYYIFINKTPVPANGEVAIDSRGERPPLKAGSEPNGEGGQIGNPLVPLPVPGLPATPVVPGMVNLAWLSSPRAHLSREELCAWQRERAKAGYRLVYLNGYDMGGSPRYAAWDISDGKNGVWYTGSLDFMQKKDAELRGKGYRPICATGYLAGRSPEFGAVWVKDEITAQEKIAFHLTEKEYTDKLKLEKENGLMPSIVTGYDDGAGSYRFTALFVLAGKAVWEEYHDLTAEQYQKAFDQQTKSRGRPMTVTVYPTPAGLRFAAVFIKDGAECYARSGLTPEQLQFEVNRKMGFGFSPICITGYMDGGVVRYAFGLAKSKARPGAPARGGQAQPPVQKQSGKPPTPHPRGSELLLCDIKTTGKSQIVLLALNGTEAKVAKSLTDGKTNDQDAVWSPDGKKIAFASDRHGVLNIYVMDADGKNVQQLTRGRIACHWPDWSPDGQHIIYCTRLRYSNSGIFKMNADGSNPVKLTGNTAEDGDPAWSPNDKKIAFCSKRQGNAFHLYIMDADGSNVRKLSKKENIYGWVFPKWSPDGSTIAYGDLGGGGVELCVCDSEGKNQKQLTHLGEINSGASWTPDGKSILFVHRGRETDTLYLVGADGNNLKKVLLPFRGRFGGQLGRVPAAALPSLPSIKKRVEEESGETKPKRRVVRVEEGEDPKAKPKSETGRPAGPAVNGDLAQLAEQAKHPALKQLFRSLAVPHDRLVFKRSSVTINGEPQKQREDNVEPVPLFLGDAPGRSRRERLRFTPLTLDWQRGKTFEPLSENLESVRPYEVIAQDKVRDFLGKDYDRRDPGDPLYLSRSDMLAAAEQALSAVLRWHESAIQTGKRRGKDWEEFEKRLRKQLDQVRRLRPPEAP